MDVLLSPPIAFLIYAAIIVGIGRLLAGPVRRTALYAGGETHPARGGVPGYRQFFVFALFFAALHLGTLILATSVSGPAALIYLGALALSLIALLLG